MKRADKFVNFVLLKNEEEIETLKTLMDEVGYTGKIIGSQWKYTRFGHRLKVWVENSSTDKWKKITKRLSNRRRS